jgi:ribonuclease P protein component
LSELPSRSTPHRLKRRADFLRAASGKRVHAKTFTLQMAPRRIVAGPAAEQDRWLLPEPPRFGFTVTKKIGKAVVRNRIRRRLKEALRALDPLPARPGHDYVMIARIDALGLPLAALQAELARALGKIDAGKTRADNSPRTSQRPDAVPERPEIRSKI